MIEFYCSVASRDSGKPTQLAAAGVVIVFNDGHDRIFTREFGWALGASSISLAEIQSAKLALCSVLPQFRGTKSVLYTTNRVTRIILEETTPEANLIIIRELKKWFGFYKDIELAIISSAPKEYITKSEALAEKALKEQIHSDSDTEMSEFDGRY